MKILHVADLHLNHDWFDWVASHASEYDLIVIAGDLQNALSNISTHSQAKALREFLVTLPVPVVVCSGNHDYWVKPHNVSIDEFAEAGWIKALKHSGQVIGVDGDVFSFLGLVHEDRWVKLAVNGWLQIPKLNEHIDIFVTHAPPLGCACAVGEEGRDVGDPELWPALQHNPPALILAGHIHASQKHACAWPPNEPTTMVLVPGCDDTVKVPNHFIIDTSLRTATHSNGETVSWNFPHKEKIAPRRLTSAELDKLANDIANAKTEDELKNLTQKYSEGWYGESLDEIESRERLATEKAKADIPPNSTNDA